MLSSILKRLRKWFGPGTRATTASTPDTAEMLSIESDTNSPAIGIVPYDENLLERSRTQWQFGDWESLAHLNRDTLQHHPDRAKLVLLAAAGRLQTGQDAEAKAYIRLSQDWGVSRRHMSQILIAGVHNSIARAAALSNQQPRALQHFETAIVIGTPGADSTFLIEGRINEQLSQLALPREKSTAIANPDEQSSPVLSSSPIGKKIDSLTDTLKEQKFQLDAQFKRQDDELIRVRKFLDSVVKKEIGNATKQIEAFVGMQGYFATGELPNVNTERHTWPICPDFALYLIELIELNNYELIIEFGSGISTLTVAKALARIASKGMREKSVNFVSFDHLEQYFQQTSALLKQAGLLDSVNLMLAPLENWKAPSGLIYSYYSCKPTLAKLTESHPPEGLRLLAIVDGPPGATGRHARYPAAPLILEYFDGARIDILLDDYIRDDEKEVVQLWQSDIAAAQLKQVTTERQLEKDACLISIFAT